MPSESINNHKFDFNISYLEKSPCRDCASKNNLPDCSDNCRTLSQIQAVLAGVTSRPSDFSDLEEFSLVL